MSVNIENLLPMSRRLCFYFSMFDAWFVLWCDLLKQ